MSAWTPILTGALADRALARVESCAGDCARAGDQASEHLGGAAAAALFHGYRWRVFNSEHDAAAASALLERSVDALARGWSGPSLHDGFLGIAWVVEHLARDDSAGDPNAAIDDVLEQMLAVDRWTDSYDLIGGLVGFAVYAMERAPRARRCLDAIVRHLGVLAEHHADGTTWPTPPHELPDWQRELAPDGYVNLGMAHGVPGVVAALAGACVSGFRTGAEPLLAGAVPWLIGCKRPDEGSWYGSWIDHDSKPYGARTAWCYGDPGVATAVLLAARAAGNAAWEAEALAIARAAATRPHDRAGVREAGLCHGAAGLGHMFNRLFHATGDELFADAARSWLEAALGMAPEGLDLLRGSPGIGLALLAAISSVEPAWDRVLLLSLPPYQHDTK